MPYYFGDLERDPNLEELPMCWEELLSSGCHGRARSIWSLHSPKVPKYHVPRRMKGFGFCVRNHDDDDDDVGKDAP